LTKRSKGDDGKLKVVDVAKKESEIEVCTLKKLYTYLCIFSQFPQNTNTIQVTEMIALSKAMEGLKEKYPGLSHHHIPICNSAAPLERDFDTLCNVLQGTNVNCPVIVNCQVCHAYYLEYCNHVYFIRQVLYPAPVQKKNYVLLLCSAWGNGKNHE
jgi:hypothetical protein